MKLRPAVATDVEAIAQIMGNWCEETPYIPALHTKEEDQAFISRVVATQDVLVADDDGVQGFIARTGSDIHQLYVAPGVRGRGIGRALLDEMKSRNDMLALWCFQANIRARRFYERHDFHPERFTDGAGNEEHLPDVRYVWSMTK
ncbi:GNAT family N-acetyltransferase [Yoonia maritima]|uniref:GNAT family N-acetyltransferase n=1 Tax=Yoonia maritima TaxID=1435347 RepID=UPI00373679AD